MLSRGTTVVEKIKKFIEMIFTFIQLFGFEKGIIHVFTSVQSEKCWFLYNFPNPFNNETLRSLLFFACIT